MSCTFVTHEACYSFEKTTVLRKEEWLSCEWLAAKRARFCLICSRTASNELQAPESCGSVVSRPRCRPNYEKEHTRPYYYTVDVFYRLRTQVLLQASLTDGCLLERRLWRSNRLNIGLNSRLCFLGCNMGRFCIANLRPLTLDLLQHRASSIPFESTMLGWLLLRCHSVNLCVLRREWWL